MLAGIRGSRIHNHPVLAECRSELLRMDVKLSGCRQRPSAVFSNSGPEASDASKGIMEITSQPHCDPRTVIDGANLPNKRPVLAATGCQFTNLAFKTVKAFTEQFYVACTKRSRSLNSQCSDPSTVREVGTMVRKGERSTSALFRTLADTLRWQSLRSVVTMPAAKTILAFDKLTSPYNCVESKARPVYRHCCGIVWVDQCSIPYRVARIAQFVESAQQQPVDGRTVGRAACRIAAAIRRDDYARSHSLEGRGGRAQDVARRPTISILYLHPSPPAPHARAFSIPARVLSSRGYRTPPTETTP
ncbi:unnamed protein product [Chilo suppressalis]|uniref:Uncharacterized protein n=1 Tax=Chilo suppressalis TaxID=168631 RepID=A0ABN8AYA3_CHISP|nr:unnamed protein product [Chilo suppressalis]